MAIVSNLDTDETVSRLQALSCPDLVVTDPEKMQRGSQWETHQPCNAKALVLPASTAELAEVMRICHSAHQSVVPYGGVTGLAHACVTAPDDIAIALDRMGVIEEIDTIGHTMTVQAGVTLRRAQEYADENGLFFPLDIGARDACTLGGNVSTNAGGTKVIRYGMARDLVLGLEAVLADGTVVSSMNRYIKNNSGLDLKQLFIGSEGTLGIITRIVFRLDVRPRSHNVALVACTEFDHVIEVLNRLKERIGATLCGFEVMWDSFFDKATTPVGRLDSPFETRYPIYAIVESMGTAPASDDHIFQEALEDLLGDDKIVDAVLAKSGKERDAIWDIRHEVEWLVRDAFNFDVSLRTSDVNEYVQSVRSRIIGDIPGTLVATFGHLGDNNMHISVLPEGDKSVHEALIEKHVYESLAPFAGAISAEHGIGLSKKAWLSVTRSAEEIELMRTLKRSLDPRNILNPGKIFDLV